MIHWTTLPHELIFQSDPHSPDSDLQEVTVNGIQMQVSMENPKEPKIVRLMSLDPNHYLDPRYQPGNTVKLEG